MKISLLITIAAMFCCMGFSYAQNTDVESIKKVIDMERQANLKRDSTAYFALFSQDTSFSATYIGSGYYSIYKWSDLRSDIAANWKRPLTRKRNTTTFSDVKVKTSGEYAIAEFISTSVDSTNKPVWQSLDTWSLAKNNGAWKINKITAVDTSSFNPNKPLSNAALEQEINMAGYRLLAVKKYPEAIRIFKLNIEMFPKEWNTYDSLAEAYMMAGNKKEAISNYEMSVKLNPENTNGKTFLEKLKKTK